MFDNLEFEELKRVHAKGIQKIKQYRQTHNTPLPQVPREELMDGFLRFTNC